jgi:hypothetical protein
MEDDMGTFVRKGNQNWEEVSCKVIQPKCAANKFRSAETIKEYEEFIAAVKLSWFPSRSTDENDEFLVDL